MEVATLQGFEKVDASSLCTALGLNMITDIHKKQIIEVCNLPSGFFINPDTSNEQKADLIYDKLAALFTELTQTTTKIPEKEAVPATGTLLFNPYEIHTPKWHLVEIIKELGEKAGDYVLNEAIRTEFESKGLGGFNICAKTVARDMGVYDADGKIITPAKYELLAQRFVVETDEKGVPIQWAYATE